MKTVADTNFKLCFFAIYTYTLFSYKHTVVFGKVKFSLVLKLPISISFFANNILSKTEYVVMVVRSRGSLH